MPDSPVSAYIAYQRLKKEQPRVEGPIIAQKINEKVKKNKSKKRPASKSQLQLSCATDSSKKPKFEPNDSTTPAKEKSTSANGSNDLTTEVPAEAGISASAALSKSAKRNNRKRKQMEKLQHLKQIEQEKQQQKKKSAPVPKTGKNAAASDSEGSCSSTRDANNVNNADDSAVINPMVEATEVFNEMIEPITTDKFFSTYWERKPLLVKRGAPGHYADWFSSEDLDWMLRNQRVMFGEHLDVTSYRDGKRETHNPEGRALAGQVWQFYQSGCSLRLLCPQVFHERVYQKLSILHELFGSFVGANIYLTPPGTQGFAPHWDDIEAFVMQLEGRKHWRVYAPRRPAERLPRESSGNFGPKDQLGQPIVDAILEPGDLLYMPRGFIHQGKCLEGWHSLHITVSTYQKFAWSDLLAEALTNALDRAAQEDVEFRRGLPLGLLGYAGSAFSAGPAAAALGDDGRVRQRRHAEEMCRSLLARLVGHVSLDEAVDKLACQQVRDALPPALDPSESARSAHAGGPMWDSRRCRLAHLSAAARRDGPKPPLTASSRVRLIRRSAIRLTTSGRLYTSLANSRVFREAEPAFLEVDAPLADGVAALISAYPDFLSVGKLPVADPEERLDLALSLYESGLLVTEELPVDSVGAL